MVPCGSCVYCVYEEIFEGTEGSFT